MIVETACKALYAIYDLEEFKEDLLEQRYRPSGKFFTLPNISEGRLLEAAKTLCFAETENDLHKAKVLLWLVEGDTHFHGWFGFLPWRRRLRKRLRKALAIVNQGLQWMEAQRLEEVERRTIERFRNFKSIRRSINPWSKHTQPIENN